MIVDVVNIYTVWTECTLWIKINVCMYCVYVRTLWITYVHIVCTYIVDHMRRYCAYIVDGIQRVL